MCGPLSWLVVPLVRICDPILTLTWLRCLNVQPPLCGRQDFVAHVAIALQSPVIHPREHSDIGIDVIIDFDHTLVIVKPVESSDVLLKRAPPRNRHRQEQCVEAGVVKPLADVAPRC